MTGSLLHRLIGGSAALSALLFLLCSLVAAGSAQALALTLGTFNGSIDAGWSTIGDVTTIDSSFGVTPPEGSGAMILTTFKTSEGPLSGFRARSQGQLENFFGFSGGYLDTLLPGKDVVQGSGVSIGFMGDAGEVLEYSYKFLTDETAADAPTYTDFFFSSLTIEGEVVREDAESSSFVTSSTQFARETGWVTVSYVLPSTTTYTLGFGVVDVADSNVGSSLILDDIKKNPEPGTGLLLMTGLAILGARRQRPARTA